MRVLSLAALRASTIRNIDNSSGCAARSVTWIASVRVELAGVH
jgi:hypothetical protein